MHEELSSVPQNSHEKKKKPRHEASPISKLQTQQETLSQILKQEATKEDT